MLAVSSVLQVHRFQINAFTVFPTLWVQQSTWKSQVWKTLSGSVRSGLHCIRHESRTFILWVAPVWLIKVWINCFCDGEEQNCVRVWSVFLTKCVLAHMSEYRCLRRTGENRWKVFFHLKPGSFSAVTYTLQYIVQWTCLSISHYNLQYIQYISQYIQYISQYIVQYILQYIWQYNLQYNLQYISQYNLQYIHYILQDTAL